LEFCEKAFRNISKLCLTVIRKKTVYRHNILKLEGNFLLPFSGMLYAFEKCWMLDTGSEV